MTHDLTRETLAMLEREADVAERQSRNKRWSERSRLIAEKQMERFAHAAECVRKVKQMDDADCVLMTNTALNDLTSEVAALRRQVNEMAYLLGEAEAGARETNRLMDELRAENATLRAKAESEPTKAMEDAAYAEMQRHQDNDGYFPGLVSEAHERAFVAAILEAAYAQALAAQGGTDGLLSRQVARD